MASFRPPPDAHWQRDGRDPSGMDELICHNDLAPWNLVAGEHEWVFIDWDLAAPGRRLWDLALAAYSAKAADASFGSAPSGCSSGRPR